MALSMDEVKDLDLKAKYSEILSAHQINNEISEVIVKIPEDLIGEHMASICEYVTVNFKGGERGPKELFLKRQIPTQDSEQSVKFAHEMWVEGTFLTKFVLQLVELCEKKLGTENDVGIHSLFPKTYFADDSEIIMDNMAVEGYIMLNKKELQNFEMASLVMKSLAKLHGASYCLIRQAGCSNAFLKRNPIFTGLMNMPGAKEMLSKMFDPAFESILKMMEVSQDSIEISDAFQKLKPYEGKLGEGIIDTFDLPNLFVTVNHGDCWNNNMMFSLKPRENPELAKLLFVDFQTPIISSPCLDIGYYIFTSTKPEVRKRTKELLKMYFDALRDLIERLGDEFPFTFEEFLVDYSVKSKMGFLFGLTMLLTMEAMEGHDPHKSGGNIDEEFTNLMWDWIGKNRDRAGEIVQDIKDKVNDFELFGNL